PRPGHGPPDEPGRGPRDPLTRALRAPPARRNRAEPAPDRCLVWLHVRRFAVEDVGDRARRKPRTHECLVHPVTGNGIDETRRIADEQSVAPREACAGTAHRQAVAADVGYVSWVDAVS